LTKSSLSIRKIKTKIKKRGKLKERKQEKKGKMKRNFQIEPLQTLQILAIFEGSLSSIFEASSSSSLLTSS
jgi:hypothetical protein